MQDLLDLTDALGVQALLSFYRTKIHERIAEKLLLLRRHGPSIQCPEYLDRTALQRLLVLVREWSTNSGVTMSALQSSLLR